MEKYLGNAVDKYCAVANIDKSRLKKVATPFLDESKDPQGCAEAGPASEDEMESGRLGKGPGKPAAAAAKKGNATSTKAATLHITAVKR